jgi:hypothetical protein
VLDEPADLSVVLEIAEPTQAVAHPLTTDEMPQEVSLPADGDLR